MASKEPKPSAGDLPANDENETPKPRSFKLRAATDGSDPADTVNRVSFGHSPRVSIGDKDVFVTETAKLAERLAADARLEEVTK